MIDLDGPHPTGTVLDDWLGGLPRGGLTLLWGPRRCGRTSLLQALARGLTSRTGTVHFNGAEPLHKGFQQTSVPAPLCREHTSLEALEEHLGRVTLAEGVDAVLIDDIERYPYGGRGRTAGIPLREVAALWARLGTMLRARDIVTVMTGTVRKSGAPPGTPLGVTEALYLMADLVIEFAPVARTMGSPHGGIVLEATIRKSRRHTPPPAHFWLRPMHEIPFSFA